MDGAGLGTNGSAVGVIVGLRVVGVRVGEEVGRVVGGDDPCAHLGDAGADTGARAPPIFTPFGQAAVGACT